MMEDQRFVLGRIVDAVREHSPDALIVAGDVYDRAVPTEEAVSAFGDFLDSVTSLGCDVYIVAGNHDSGTRLEFCGPILNRHGVHIAGEFTGKAERIVTEDEYGRLNIYLLPYFKVSEVRSLLGREVRGYGEAMETVLDASGVDPSERNVLVAHQFFAGSSSPVVSDSEEQRPEVGGIECIPVGTLGAFDYVALGHLHIPQSVGRPTVRYSGSPLKYSGSEALHPKSLTLADVRGKGDVSVDTVPLAPLRDLRVVRGRVEDIVREGLDDDEDRDDYIIVELTERPGQDASEIRKVYPRTMAVSIARPGDRIDGEMHFEPERVVDPEGLFAEFYRSVTGEDLSDYQREILRDCIYTEGAE